MSVGINNHKLNAFYRDLKSINEMYGFLSTTLSHGRVNMAPVLSSQQMEFNLVVESLLAHPEASRGYATDIGEMLEEHATALDTLADVIVK